jgi:hypothetical protein
VHRESSHGSTQLSAPGSAPPPASVSSSRAAWHSPAITIIDLKRTMFGGGFYLDGINLSTT